MVFGRLSSDMPGLCKYRNAFQLPWPRNGRVVIDTGEIYPKVPLHHVFPSSAASLLFSVFLFQVTSSVPLFPNLFCWSSSEGSLVLRSSFWEQRSKAGCKVGWSQPHQSITVLCLQVQANGCKKMCHLWLSAAQYQRNIYACYIFRSTSESKAHLPVFSLGRSSIVLLNHDFFWSSWRHLNKCENLHTSVFQRCLLD